MRVGGASYECEDDIAETCVVREGRPGRLYGSNLTVAAMYCWDGDFDFDFDSKIWDIQDGMVCERFSRGFGLYYSG